MTNLITSTLDSPFIVIKKQEESMNVLNESDFIDKNQFRKLFIETIFEYQREAVKEETFIAKERLVLFLSSAYLRLTDELDYHYNSIHFGNILVAIVKEIKPACDIEFLRELVNIILYTELNRAWVVNDTTKAELEKLVDPTWKEQVTAYVPHIAETANKAREFLLEGTNLIGRAAWQACLKYGQETYDMARKTLAAVPAPTIKESKDQ